MTWYWIVFVTLLFFTFYEQFCKNNEMTIRIIAITYTIFFIFIASIRWGGTLGDWRGYKMVFDTMINMNSITDLFNISYWPFEPLYYIIMRLIKYFTNSYTLLLLFMAIVAIYGYYKAAVYVSTPREINEQTYGPDRSILLASFLAFWSICCANIFTVRTNMAVALCMYSVKYIEEKKPVKFIIMVVVATMFHFTAIIFLPAYLIYNIKLNYKWMVRIFFLFILVRVIGIDKLLGIASLLGGRYAEKLESAGYGDNGVVTYSYLSYSGAFLIIRAFANTAVIVVLILIIRNYMEDDPRYNGLVNLYIFGAFLQAILLLYNFQVARLAIMYTFSQCLLLPYCLRIKTEKPNNRFIIFAGYALFMAVKFYSLIHSSEAYATFGTIFSN